MPDNIRTFAALDVSDMVRQRVESVSAQLNRAGWQARWVTPERAHITMHFYGDLEPATIEQLRSQLGNETHGIVAPMIRLSGIGAFPSPKRPRVLWLGLSDVNGDVSRVKDAVECATKHLNLDPDDRPFKPHLTIGRIRREFRGPSSEQTESFKRAGNYPSVEWQPEKLLLLRSELTRDGPIYTTIEAFPLAKSSSTGIWMGNQ
jgi:RNA 2',3'-cyclic 3'-phosphodiesterase